MKKILLIVTLSSPLFLQAIPGTSKIFNLKEKKALIKITSKFFTLFPNAPTIEVELKRHTANRVIIKALKKETEAIENLITTEPRGDNRVNVELIQPGTYQITVPDDADTTIKLKQGNIKYLDRLSSMKSTQLSIKGTTVNRWGHNGHHVPGDKYPESWSYFWGTEKDPIIKLITQQGRITIPTY